MKRYRLWLSYDGADYLGFQVQRQGATIQSEIESALTRLLGETVRVIPSGRTDSGVHALEQVVHFDANTPKAHRRLAAADAVYRLNSILPAAILIRNIKQVSPSFHARKSAKKKSYIYVISNSSQKNPFLNEHTWRIPQPLDGKAMKQAAACLIGTHDFSAFCASDSGVKNKTRRLISISFLTRRPAGIFCLPGETYLTIRFVGTGFLKQMIRRIVGTLVAVGQGKMRPGDLRKILVKKDRKAVAATAPARGLYLEKVWY